MIVMVAAVIFTAGGIGMRMVGHGEHAHCPIALMLGTDCASVAARRLMFLHHVDLMQTLTSSSSLDALVTVIAFVLVLIGAVRALMLGSGLYGRGGPPGSNGPEIALASPRRNVLRWSALHTRADGIARPRACPASAGAP